MPNLLDFYASFYSSARKKNAGRGSFHLTYLRRHMAITPCNLLVILAGRGRAQTQRTEAGCRACRPPSAVTPHPFSFLRASNRDIHELSHSRSQSDHLIHSLLFQGSKVGNPLSGTVLDSTISSNHLYDFYLVSQVSVLL